MDSKQTTCDDSKLLEMLQSEADDSYSSNLFEHVSQCTRCQSRLEEFAAQKSEWKQASEILRSFSKTDDGSSSENRGRAWRGSDWIDRPVAWTESMARQLLSPPSHPEMLGRISRYEVERLIGTGGMGIVFKAIDTELNRPVAIKILAPYLSGSGPARKRFAREARAAAAVVHEHVVPIHNVETDGDSPFLVMHYVPGESLQGRLDREGMLELCEILRIGMQVASGLAAAHEQGLVHRDVKPSNILLEHGVERALITDFGLAQTADDASLTHTGYHPGTPQYMSPEQARGDAVDNRSDLFSLGSVLYAMCTGKSPFRAETSYGVLRRIIDTDPQSIRQINPAIPIWLESIVNRLISKDIGKRFATAMEVSEILKSCLAHVQHPSDMPLPASLRPNTLSKAFTNLPHKSAWIFATIGIVLFCVFTDTIGHTIGQLFSRNGFKNLRADASFVQSKDNLNNDLENTHSMPMETVRWLRPEPVRPYSELAEKTRKALSAIGELNCDEITIGEAIADLQQSCGIHFSLNRVQIIQSDISLDQKVSIKLRGAFRDLLRSIVEPNGMGYIVHDNYVEIGPLDYVTSRPSVRNYDLAFVIADPNQADSIVSLILQTVAPGSWNSQGGVNSIARVDTALIVRSSETTHLQIESLLLSIKNLQQPRQH